jgi:hypothetical protein
MLRWMHYSRSIIFNGAKNLTRSGAIWVTYSPTNGCQRMQMSATMEDARNPHEYWRDATVHQRVQMHIKVAGWPFHGGNTGSNPVGDANRLIYS